MYRKILVQVAPIFFGIILTYSFWHNNLLLAVLYVLAIVVFLKIEYHRGDIHALIIGCIVGFAVEAIGTSVAGYQSFANPDFFGIPMWLPIVWGYGFLFMKRVGVIINNSEK
jgi:hypothetical protein